MLAAILLCVAQQDENVHVPDGFSWSRVRTATEAEGSWISMAFKPDGTLYVSPQQGTILRIAPNEHGTLGAGTAQPIGVQLGGAQGMLWAFDALYVNIAGDAQADGGLHRLRDTDGDGLLDHDEHLLKCGPGSEHGMHGFIQGQDGWIHTVWGNHVDIPSDLASASSPFTFEKEGVMLTTILDPRGHAHGRTLPAGTWWRFRPDGSEWQLMAGGMRNSYDITSHAGGEVFAYDSDMEWDIGTPWYRPPRLLHLVPGADYGWRTGSGKLAEGIPDTWPGVAHTDYGSPTGMESGHRLRFGEAWENTLLIGDWSYGRIHAVHLQPSGSSFTGDVELFAEGRPWSVSDLVAGPDGALYVLTGGRGTQSVLDKITGPGAGEVEELRGGEEETSRHPERTRAATLRIGIEAGDLSREEAWFFLGVQDRFLRSAAREFLVKHHVSWLAEQVFQQNSVATGLESLRRRSEGVLGLSRIGEEYSVEVSGVLLSQDWTHGDAAIRQSWVRAAQWVCINDPSLVAALGEDLVQKAEDLLPIAGEATKRSLLELWTGLPSRNLFHELEDRISKWREDSKTAMHAAWVLSHFPGPWPTNLTATVTDWAVNSSAVLGGASLEGFVVRIAGRLRAQCGEGAWDAALQETHVEAREELYAVPEPGEVVKKWTVDSALAAVSEREVFASAQNGFEVLGRTGCLACHRFNSNGNGLGPDLTGVGRRFDRRVLLESILEPSKVVSDQYQNIIMPPGLLDSITDQELADLILFLEFGGR